MTVRQLHILIEQMFNQMGNFAYEDLEPEEVDVAINFTLDLALRNAFSPKDNRVVAPASKNGYEDIVLIAEDYKVLKITDYNLTNLTTVGNKVKGDLPDDFLHLINDSSVLNKPNCASVTKPNRLTDGEFVKQLLNTDIAKTSALSPISEFEGRKLSVYFEGFTVTGILIDYYRKPQPIAYGTDGSALIEFSDTTCNKIALYTTHVMSIWNEQPQLKQEALRFLNAQSQ